MARTKGTRNHEGHKAGGARKGAGRKRKASTERVLEEEQSLQSRHILRPSAVPDNYIDLNQIHPALKRYIKVPHHVPLVVTPAPHPREAPPESPPSFRLSFAAWESTPSEELAAPSDDIGSSMGPLIHHSQPFALPASSQILHQSLPVFSQRSGSEPARPEVTRAQVLYVRPSIAHTERSWESPPDFVQAQPDAQVQNMQQSKVSTSSATRTQPSFPASLAASRPRPANIMPAPVPQQTRTWTFPYPLPTVMSSPFHRLAIVSQGSSNKRRRRRCAVCIRLDREEASYDCPGRGDRSRCPFSRKRDEVAGVTTKHRCRLDHKSRDNKARNPPCSMSGHPEGISCLHWIAPALPEPSVLIQDGRFSLAHYGQPVQHFVFSSGETVKRRARRCMVCVTRGRDGISCAGRGSRTLCPDYDEALDARTIKGLSLDAEEEMGDSDTGKT